MAEKTEALQEEVRDDETDNPNYKAPAMKSLDEIKNLDKDDESLEKYKLALLGGSGDVKRMFPDNPNNVVVQKLSFCSEGRDEIDMDLSNINDIEKKTFHVKEGTKYCLKIHFAVQKDIVSGLRYKQVIKRKGITMDGKKMMVGSYGPKESLHVYTSPEEEVPSGMLARGSYKIVNSFTDDDKNEIIKWEFGMEIKKEWDD